MKPILHVQDLRVQFDTVDGTVHAVNGVSFDLFPGETLGVVGESGSGKSVSMMSLLRLIPEPPGKIVSGTARFRTGDTDMDLLTLNRKEMARVRGNRIGFVFQDPLSSLNPLMTIGKQIEESLEQHTDLTGPAARKRVLSLLEQVGIPDPEARYRNYPHQFSGGMRQRVMIAIAIACDPDIIIADEPTTALDVTVQAQIVDLMNRLGKERGIAVIWISHDLGVVAGIADRVMVMYGGTVVERGPADPVYSHPRHPYTVGLLGALPKLHENTPELVDITGTPPDLYTPPQQCPFAPRCPWAFQRCRSWMPRLFPVDLPAALPRDRYQTHESACWYDLETQAPRQLPPGEKNPATSKGRS
ncbi:dipeptide/oligopeptide/nickel ABC transporter ATP-binding protein [Alkalispirochaeta sphaeroplastigenens]|uniref:Dipeptide/oligopeptide/nickel ABC transporter ATP-binding protein n=1 Tax=Alkalispirochaeta sphaeroplastigenens TaxID=1187066 RepID=A0A2S4K114_9SPIO|nr:ABC transporter ATP-binding protein [Alkalispirochaeta sphaeroplastigenens]POR05457.1 dipeptide/oligopeptide/nickel ABC transporter ATP-binding protein [Alkalispirochaeta sphaeroplastigenens]